MVKGICKRCSISYLSSGENKCEKCPANFQQALYIINDEFCSRDCNINYVINKAKINKDEFRYCFYLCFHMTPTKFIESLKFELALYMLKENENINLISDWCGYDYIGTFRHAFKRRLGFSPDEIREQIMCTPDPRAFIKDLQDKLFAIDKENTGK